MTDKIEIQGKTVDAAVSEALLQMGARRDEVEIKVLEEPKSGFLGMLGGRPARVLVRMKRGGRRGGGKDYRQEQDGYQLNDGGGRNRGGSRRKGGGRKEGKDDGDKREARDSGRDDNRRGGRGRGRGRQDQNQNQKDNQGGRDRQEVRAGGDTRSDTDRKPTRRGSRGGRGRGGRGRKADAADQNQNQNQDVNAETKQQRNTSPDNDRNEQRRERSRRGRRTAEKPAETQRDAAPNTGSEPSTGTDPRRERSRRDRRPAAEVAPAETPTPPAAEAKAPVKSVNEMHPIRRAAEKKTETDSGPAPAKPGARRAYGPLGSRRKSKLADDVRRNEKREAEARKTAEEPVAAPPVDEAAARAAASPGEIRRKGASSDGAGDSGSADRGPKPRREGPRSYRETGDEVIAEAIAATSYAQPVAAPADEAALETLSELTTGMLARAGFPCEVETKPDEYSQVIVSTDEENAGMLIGRHGQTVEAVEHLVDRMACNAAGDRVRMNLDINEYRVRRQEALLERVAQAAEDVRKTGQAYHMEPMSARERRIVHMGAADLEGLRTFTMMGSRGKQVVIAVDDGSEDGPADEPVFGDRSDESQ